jgi:hypothetical protein
MPLNPNPSFISEKDQAEGYHAIGRFAVFWGPVELLIENMIVMLRHRQRLPEPEPWVFPVSFSKKTEELKDRLKAETEIEEMRDALRPMLGRAKELHAMRVHIVHSYFQGQHLNGKLMFGRSDQKRGVSYTEARYSIDEIRKATAEMIALHDHMEVHWLPLQRFCTKPAAR